MRTVRAEPRARDVMRAIPACIPASATLTQLRCLFRRPNLAHAAVVGPAGALLGVVSGREVMSVCDSRPDERPTRPALAPRGAPLASINEALFCALDFVVRDVSVVPADMPVRHVAGRWAGYGDLPVVVVGARLVPIGMIFGPDLALLSAPGGPLASAPRPFKATPYAQGVHR